MGILFLFWGWVDLSMSDVEMSWLRLQQASVDHTSILDVYKVF